MADVPNIRQIVNATQTGFMDASLVVLMETFSHRPTLSDIYLFALIVSLTRLTGACPHSAMVCDDGRTDKRQRSHAATLDGTSRVRELINSKSIS